jgi:diguanylate cyclase
MRALLRDGVESTSELSTLVAALDGQVKRMATVNSERAKAILVGFETLLQQLQKLQPENTAKQQLREMKQQLKPRSQRISEYSSLVNDYAKVQLSVLSDRNIQRISKPFWHKWQPEITEKTTDSVNSEQQAPLQFDITAPDPLITTTEDRTFEADHNLADDNKASLPNEQLSVDEEPPFSRLNGMICSILQELLRNIEPSDEARQNYQRAREQVDKGLNWYELVPTLEDISKVVVSAFDKNQQEFESFLTDLNDRLIKTYEHINESKEVEGESSEARRQVTQSMRDQVSAMQHSVSIADELEQLKEEVNTRLDNIVSAMDQQHTIEQQRASSLSEQLDALGEQVKMMEHVSSQAEKHLEEQRQRALRDELTQLPNRAAYEQRLALEFDRWKRYDRPLSMVVGDIDFFKRVNDSFGHQAGDKVLRIIAKTLGTRLRKTDFVGRYGGEEFVLLMPETDQEEALTVAEGVREAIANCPFHFKDQELTITMSFGITEFHPDDQCDEVFNRADQALYKAKNNGRNCCVVAESSNDE